MVNITLAYIFIILSTVLCSLILVLIRNKQKLRKKRIKQSELFKCIFNKEYESYKEALIEGNSDKSSENIDFQPNSKIISNIYHCIMRG